MCTIAFLKASEEPGETEKPIPCGILHAGCSDPDMDDIEYWIRFFRKHSTPTQAFDSVHITFLPTNDGNQSFRDKETELRPQRTYTRDAFMAIAPSKTEQQNFTYSVPHKEKVQNAFADAFIKLELDAK